MKLANLLLVITLSLTLILGVCPSVRADDSKAEVDLKVEIVVPPSVTTGFALPGSGWALVLGRLTDMGSASSVDVYFEWGETTDYGSTTRVRTVTSPRRFWAIIRGLTPGTTYHFRAVAVGDGTGYGEDRSFTTIRPWWWRWRWWRWW